MPKGLARPGAAGNDGFSCSADRQVFVTVALFALDYAFRNTLTLSDELYYSGAGAADRSQFFSPSLVYSLRTNVDLMVGAQLFRGAQGSEYARLNDAYYAQIQWFF